MLAVPPVRNAPLHPAAISPSGAAGPGGVCLHSTLLQDDAFVCVRWGPPWARLGSLRPVALARVACRSLDALQEVLGEDNAALNELQTLFTLAEAYGYADWLVFDASVVRGLAYYTGTVFEAFDREGVLRAICGGGRYDKLMSAFGACALPLYPTSNHPPASLYPAPSANTKVIIAPSRPYIDACCTVRCMLLCVKRPQAN